MSTAPSVAFPSGVTGSTLLMGAMTEAKARYSDILDVSIPTHGPTFKKALPLLIGEFEARRAASADRVDIARTLSDHVASRALWGEQALVEGIRGTDAGPSVISEGTAKPGWTPSVTYGGRTWTGVEIVDLADRLRLDCMLTEAAADALKWTARELSNPLDLTGQRFAVMGAQAELAPTQILLQAGARVLWVDRQAPELDPSTFAGTLVHHPDALDLLTQTPAVHAAIAQEAAEGPLHLGLYAYAPGRGRELTLTAAMNAIADDIQPASVAILVSPTTPGEVQPEDRRDRTERRRSAPRWQRALARGRMLPEPSFHEQGSVQISKSIVGLQGSTYLAAQYLMKMMTAEAWTETHPDMRLSCNVAGITHTKSLLHPLFLAGFLGAPLFGIHVFTPEQTRVLNTMMVLHDILNPAAPAATATSAHDRAKALTAQSIHGGVRSAPFVLEQSIRAAAVIGLTKKPGLLLQLRK